MCLSGPPWLGRAAPPLAVWVPFCRGGRARVLLNLGTSPQGTLLRAPAVDFPGVAASPTDMKYSCRREGGATSGRPPQVIEQRLQTRAAARKRDAQTPRLSEAGRQDNGTHGRAARRLLPEPPSSGTVEAGTSGGQEAGSPAPRPCCSPELRFPGQPLLPGQGPDSGTDPPSEPCDCHLPPSGH